jgi:hypothetical protein
MGKDSHTLEERFWSKVDKGGPVHPALGTACWTWTAYRNPKGYGILGRDGSARLAHRIAWEIERGPIPDGLFACHRCDNPACVRVEHLFLGTSGDNTRDAAAKGRLVSPARLAAVPRADEHWTHRRPERVARGDANGSRRFPERSARGERNGCAKLTTEQVRAIRARYAAGEQPTLIARDVGMSKSAVFGIVKGRRWRHVA